MCMYDDLCIRRALTLLFLCCLTELYFLIARFLEDGPCPEAAQVKGVLIGGDPPICDLRRRKAVSDPCVLSFRSSSEKWRRGR